jgi:hypothetical protein
MAGAVAAVGEAGSPVFRWPDDADAAERLPPVAKAKLLALRDADENARALAQELSAQRTEAFAKKAAAEARHGALTLPHLAARVGGSLYDDGHPSVVQARKLIAAAQAEIDGIARRTTALQSSRWLGLRSLEAFVGGLRGRIEMAPQISPKIGKAGIVVEIETARADIARIGADIHTTRSASLPAAVVKNRLAQEIEALAARGPNVMPAIEAGLPLQWPMVDVQASVQAITGSETPQIVTGFASHQAHDVLGLLAYLFKDQLLEKLSAEVDELADDAGALTPEERAEREAELRAELLAAERLEERLIEIAAAEGRDVMRRPSADARAILGIV